MTFENKEEFIKNLITLYIEEAYKKKVEERKKYEKYKDRNLDKIEGLEITIPRNIETYREFNMICCKKPEIQFLSLVKSYNKLINEDDNCQKTTFNKIKIKGFVKRLEGDGCNLVDFKIIEKAEEVNDVKKSFHDNIIFMFFSYLDRKYNFEYYYQNFDEIRQNTLDEIFEFGNKFFLALEKETIFAKDIESISKQYREDPNKYEIENVKKTIYDIINNPIEIESGYVQMIIQLISELENSQKNKYSQEEKEKHQTDDDNINCMETTKLDKLNKEQKKAIEDILLEAPVYLKHIKYSSEAEFDMLSYGPKQSERKLRFQEIVDKIKDDMLVTKTQELNEVAIRIIDPLVKKCKTILNGDSEQEIAIN